MKSLRLPLKIWKRCGKTPKMILIDTSAWIASFKKTGNHELKEFMRQVIVAGLTVTSPVIILELLQGCRSVEERDALKIKMESLDFLSITLPVSEQSSELGVSLKRNRLTTAFVFYTAIWKNKN